jgi:hypothetical protein
MRAIPSRRFMISCLLATLACALGCSSPSSTTNSSTGSGSGSNVQPISVNTGPDIQLGEYIDGAFTSVTVCAPGSTTNCQTISDVLIDTGSSGLRILSSALTATLAQQTSGGNPIAECAQFEDGFTWGPVQTADVKIAGEQASSLPIQVIGSPNFPTIPGDCQGVAEDTLADLGANGLLGIGQTIQDCGVDCTESGAPSAGVYYSCPNSGCVDTTESLPSQVQNPVASFATDNNGVIVELPAVSISQPDATLSGSLIFGIGTQPNNVLGNVTIYGTDPYGDFYTTYKSVNYTGFLDSGSNAIYFLDSPTTGIATCADYTFWYCPATTQTISVVNTGLNDATGSPSFLVGNADTLIDNNDAAIAGLGGPLPGLFDFGLPFFFGRNVYIAIDGQPTPGGTGPYTAYSNP